MKKEIFGFSLRDIAEIAIPLSTIGAEKGSIVMFNASLSGKDTFTGAKVKMPSTWMNVILK